MKITPSRRSFALLTVSGAEKRFLSRLLADTMVLLGEEETPEAEAADPGDAAPSAADLERLFGTSAGERPTDPALLRLLPDADGEDEERSSEFRRLTETDIRQSKLANLRAARFSLGAVSPISLDRQTVHAWAVALTDIRLVIATRLEIASDADFEELYENIDSLDEHTQTMLSVYDFLTWAQEQFASILVADLEDSEVPQQSEDE